MPDQRDAHRLLDRTCREIAAWRRKHVRGRMPNRLWVQAAEAAAELGPEHVASRCELDRQRLRDECTPEGFADRAASLSSTSRFNP